MIVAVIFFQKTISCSVPKIFCYFFIAFLNKVSVTILGLDFCNIPTIRLLSTYQCVQNLSYLVFSVELATIQTALITFDFCLRFKISLVFHVKLKSCEVSFKFSLDSDLYIVLFLRFNLKRNATPLFPENVYSLFFLQNLKLEISWKLLVIFGKTAKSVKKVLFLCSFQN